MGVNSMEETLREVSNIFTTIFAVTTMLAMGLSLRLKQVLAPLRSIRIVAGALSVNFVIVPLAALLLAELFSLAEDLRIGLLLISVAAGAPLVPKLAQVAKGSVPTAVALVGLLVVATLVYMPLVLPLMLPDVEVDALGMALTLLLQLLLPLGIGLAAKASFDDLASGAQPKVALLSTASLAIMLVLLLGLNLGDVITLFGRGAVGSILLLTAVALAAGYALGVAGQGRRRVAALAAGQRNLAAAFVVGTANFADRPDTMATLVTAGVLGMVTVIPVAVAFGRLSKQPTVEAAIEGSVPPATQLDVDAHQIEELLSEAERRRDEVARGDRRPGYRRG
jgi:BASS family bile acid:Na+ symporter